MRYVARVPKVVPKGMVLVHNHVKPAPALGVNGFRAWLAPTDPKLWERCPCTWAPATGPHYRVCRVR
jgi:hypothetical protein